MNVEASCDCRSVGDNPPANEEELAIKANVWQRVLEVGLRELYPEVEKIGEWEAYKKGFEEKYTLAEDELLHLKAFIDAKHYIIAHNYARQLRNDTHGSTTGLTSLTALTRCEFEGMQMHPNGPRPECVKEKEDALKWVRAEGLDADSVEKIGEWATYKRNFGKVYISAEEEADPLAAFVRSKAQ